MYVNLYFCSFENASDSLDKQNTGMFRYFTFCNDCYFLTWCYITTVEGKIVALLPKRMFSFTQSKYYILGFYSKLLSTYKKKYDLINSHSYFFFTILHVGNKQIYNSTLNTPFTLGMKRIIFYSYH